ncbi:MAG TPA: hypothetical protein VOB72_09055 [Candidatus Dormibacteraeota bacterium]|nr:hypothetical protein [Candidatus Dormibacteraeota bacterium]
MSEHDEQDGLDQLERQLDAAFAATRPRRGFEDELWARLEPRRRRIGIGWSSLVPLAAVGGAAVVLLAGVVLVAVGAFSGGFHGGGAASTASRPADSGGGVLATGRTAPGAFAPAALPFGPVPAPPNAGVSQVVQDSRLSPLPAAFRVAIPDTSLPQPGTSITVFRYDPNTGPPSGAILEPGALPPGIGGGAYPSRPAADALADASARGAGANQSAQAGAAVTLTQVRLVYVAVVAGDEGFLEPAYLFTGTYQNGGDAVTAQLLLPALAASAVR